MDERLKKLAGEFAARIKASDINGSTIVILIYHWIDERGREVAVTREEIGTFLKVSGGPQDFNQKIASGIYLDTIVGNVRNAVLGSPQSLVMRSGLPMPVRVGDIEMEIKKI